MRIVSGVARRPAGSEMSTIPMIGRVAWYPHAVSNASNTAAIANQTQRTGRVNFGRMEETLQQCAATCGANCCRRRELASSRAWQATSLVPGSKDPAELVAKRSESLGGCRVRAFGVLAQFLGLLRTLNRAAAETNAPARGIHFEDDDLDVGAYRQRLDNVGFPRHAGLARGYEACPARGEKYKHAELLVALHLSSQASAWHDCRLRRRRRGSTRRTLLDERNADSPLIGIDAENLECGGHPHRNRPRPLVAPA